MISSTFDKNKVFTVMWSELENRIDTSFYTKDFRKIFGCKKYPMTEIRKVVLESFNGFAAGKENQSEYGILQIRPTNLVNDELSVSKSIYVDNCQENYLIKKNDVLFNNTNSRVLVGKTIVYKSIAKATVSNHITVLRVDSNSILAEYLAIILNLYQRKKIFYNICTNWNNQSGINYSVLKKIKIPLPNLTTQNEIINIYNSLVEAQKNKLSQAEELLKSIDTYLLSELNLQLPELKNDLTNRKYIVKSKEIIGNRFDGFYNRPEFIDFLNKVLLLSNNTTLCDVIYGESGVVYKTEDERNSGIGILRANNIDVQSNELDLSDIKYINDELVLPKRQKLLANDILMCSASGSKSHAGKVAFIENDLPYYFGGFMMVLRAKSEVNMRYVFEYMCSSIYRTLLFRSLGGTNINNVNFELIKNIPIILPDNQTEIVNKIKHIRECAKTLKIEAQQCIDSARAQIEQIILGEY